MKNEYNLEHFPVESFARSDGHLNGALSLVEFERLRSQGQGDCAAAVVAYHVEGFTRSDGGGGGDQIWLTLSAQVVLPMVCQRCMTVAELTVQCDREFRFVATEEQAEEQDELSEEDVLVLSRDFNLTELIEDELLMAMPMVPMHDACPVPVKLAIADANFDDAAHQNPNPFAVLGKLKNGG